MPRMGRMEVEEMEELKKCPFCGGDAVLVATSVCSGFVSCVGDCKIATSKYWDTMLNHETKEKWSDKVIKAWNRRCCE